MIGGGGLDQITSGTGVDIITVGNAPTWSDIIYAFTSTATKVKSRQYTQMDNNGSQLFE